MTQRHLKSRSWSKGMNVKAVLAWMMVCNGLFAVSTAGEGQCGTNHLPKPGDTVLLSSMHWKRNTSVPCQQGNFQLLLTKDIGRGWESQIYEAQLQQCTAATGSQVLSPDSATTHSNSSSCQHYVDACKLPSGLTEPGRRLALKMVHKGMLIMGPAPEGCGLPWMDEARDVFLTAHTILSGVSANVNAVTSYLVGDVYPATAGPEAQQGSGAPAQLLDLVDGRDLESMGRLGPVDTHRAASQVLRTLVDISKKGWLHPDIHLRQIVCSAGLALPPNDSPMADGNIANCVLVDFDHMVFLGNATDIPTSLEGYEYRAPEFYKGRVASTSDVWSLGFAVLVMRGGWPFGYMKGLLQEGKESSIHTLAALRLSEPYMHLLPEEWDFIQRCMVYDWKDRPTTAVLLAEDNYIMNFI